MPKLVWHREESGRIGPIRDQRYGGTPSGWVRENSQDQAAEYLERIAKRRAMRNPTRS